MYTTKQITQVLDSDGKSVDIAALLTQVDYIDTQIAELQGFRKQATDQIDAIKIAAPGVVEEIKDEIEK